MHDAGKNAGQEPHEQGRLVPVGLAATPATRSDPYGSPAYAAAPMAGGADFSATLMQYVHLALKRKWLILSIVLAMGALGTLKAFMTTPRYTAAVRIQIEREAAKVLERGSAAPQEEGGLDFLKTQFELLRSRTMAERVVAQLRLGEQADFVTSGSASLTGALTGVFKGAPKAKTPAELDAQAIKIVTLDVDVKPIPGSRLVDITYIDTKPWRAQLIANSYAEAFVASTVDKRFQANSFAKAFLDDQIKQLKIKMEESEQALLNFAEQEKIVEANDKASIAENNLAAANTTLGQLVSERIKNEQLWKQVQNATAINLPQLLSNSVIEVLRGQRKALETEYQEKLENFKPGYPAMVQISNKLKEIDRQLAAEVKTIRNSFKAAYESSLGQENEMKTRIEALRAEVLELQKKGIQYNILKREVETNRGLYNSLLQRYKEVDIAGGAGSNNVFIIDRAVLPQFPSEPNLVRMLMISLGIGVFLGGALSYFLEILDDRVRAPEELEQLSGVATLGIVPRVEKDMDKALRDPRSASGEAHRSLATALQFSTESGLPRSLSITSSGPGEGKSTTAVALSRYFASLGLKVLLVDADLRKPSLHEKLNLDNSIGFSNYLTGASLPPEVVQKTDHPNLAFMASGPLPPNAADLLGGNRVYSLISLGSEVFDLIVLDCPPVMGLADAQLLASATAATVFVVSAGMHRKGMIRAALRRLQLSRVGIVGTVLTRFDAKSVGYGYGYGYGHGYGYGYGYGYGGAHDKGEAGEMKKLPTPGLK
jgi:capsular exopolysaccharide synthesis family protein